MMEVPLWSAAINDRAAVRFRIGNPSRVPADGHGNRELPLVLVVEHAVGVCRGARSQRDRLFPLAGTRRAIPKLPITVMAQARRVVTVVPAKTPRPARNMGGSQASRERWNDYGIGLLLLQGDFKDAIRCTKVIEI